MSSQWRISATETAVAMASLHDHLNHQMGPYSGLVGWALEYFYLRRDRLFDGRAQPVAAVSFDGRVIPVGQFKPVLEGSSSRLLLPVEISTMNAHSRKIDHGDVGLTVITSVTRPGNSFVVPLVIGREQPLELSREQYATATFVCRRGDLYSYKDPIIGVYGNKVVVTGAEEAEIPQFPYPRGRQDWPPANIFESKPDYISEKCDLCRHYVHSIECPRRLRQVYCGRCSEVFGSVETYRQHLEYSHNGFKRLVRRWF